MLHLACSTSALLVVQLALKLGWCALHRLFEIVQTFLGSGVAQLLQGRCQARRVLRRQAIQVQGSRLIAPLGSVRGGAGVVQLLTSLGPSTDPFAKVGLVLSASPVTAQPVGVLAVQFG